MAKPGSVAPSAALQMAVQWYRQGRADIAAALCGDLLRQQPDHPEALNMLAALHVEAKQPAQAVPLFERLLARHPGHADAWCNRGVALLDLGRPDEARASFERAIAARPAFPQAHNNLGNALEALGDYAAAVAAYERALALRPDYAEAHCNCGNALASQQRWAEALAAYDRALALRADYPLAHYNRANTLGRLQRWADALAAYDCALALNPGYAEAWHNRGNVLASLDAYAEAVVSYERALALRPDRAETHHDRATALFRLKRLPDALAAYRQAYALNPALPDLRGNLAHLQTQLADWDGLEALIAEIEADLARGEPVCSPFPLLALSARRDLQLIAARRWAPAAPQPASVLPPHTRNGRLRIAYFSADFRNHPVTHLLAGVLEQHDRERVEISAFSFGPCAADDADRARVRAAVEHFHDVLDLTDDAVVALARAQHLDIAIDLGGYTHGNRPGLFAARVAPLQLSYLGYMGSSGTAAIDYLVADAVTVPPEHEGDYSEAILRLPHCLMPGDTTRPLAATVPTRRELGLPEQGFVFCAFNGLAKILPATFGVWLDLLRQVDGSVLWLSPAEPAAIARLRGVAEAAGVAGERLVFAARMPQLADHLARHRAADLFLDTLPYNAHSTANDALWAGLPVLTCRGETLAGRVAASLLTTLGLPELIADTPADYAARALALARDPAHLAALRARLAAQRSASPLFDLARYTRELEAALFAIQARHEAGLAPGSLDVAA